jgi:hypothetical protein
MALRVSLFLAVAGALAILPTAAAAPVQLKVGDSVDVTSTKIGCFTEYSAGRRAITCELTTTKGPVKSTYGIGINARGDTIVTHINATGKGAKTVWAARGIASARAQMATYYELRTGDTFGFHITGGDIGCDILNIKQSVAEYSGIRVVCFRSIKGKPIANSYGVVLSNKFAGQFKFTAKSAPGATTFVRPQPK